MNAVIRGIAFHLPEKVLTNAQLGAEHPDWAIEKIEEKTGIVERHIAGEAECASDLAAAAARKLIGSGVCGAEDIDYLLLCTQSPDYFLPTSACLIQHRLGLPTRVGALDINLGCSGFVYALGLAKGLIETGQARGVVVLTADTLTKFIHPSDRSVRTVFGDAGAAVFVQGVDAAGNSAPNIGPFVYGTDGGGGDHLMVPVGGLRKRYAPGCDTAVADDQGNLRSPCNLHMNGPEIFTFTLRTVPAAVNALLAKSGLTLEQIDLFVFHQANRQMLEHLRKKLKIPEQEFVIGMSKFGNTTSSTIPVALKQALDEGRLRAGQLVMIVGFGVGNSWAAGLIRWV